jgi:hypothetical protein
MSILHAGIDYTDCLHVLQAHDDPDRRRIGNETCTRALGTCVPNNTDMFARLFFMLETRGS